MLRRPSALPTRCAGPWPVVVAGGSITGARVAARGGGRSGSAAERVGRGPDAEMGEDERRDVDDARASASPVDADREERHLGVAGNERAVRAAADVVPAAEVGELVALGGRDEHLARVRVRERRPGAAQRIRVVEDRRVAAQREAAAGGGGEDELLPVAARDRLAPFAEQDDLDRRCAVEPRRDPAWIEPAAGRR